ncbi:TrkH family potassium uptake protein [Aliishimia ponticola]|uniref:Trk system potassium uptake protein n=1 Tax=Aliishimia ponticola TaxID=2499833 RepID=A0A4S4ND45_9RHOB|nr:TrkH family potassium uptake protein [Aliishimia ponticola]THH37396.1 TrkH family potassium uptake protein [Aliishimia ponticola]
MVDLRPVGYVIGLLLTVLGATMLLPLLVDVAEGLGHWPVFMQSAALTMLIGGFLALSCANGVREGLTLQETFLLVTSVWLFLPIFGALPFLLGETASAPVDAFFEAMSALTTTGSTVLTGIEHLPKGLLLWRGIMQWLGGVGIIVFAMVFLPELRVGGMQIFRSEAFDTMGKILPRATEIASRISVIYVSMTLTCIFCYLATGLNAFDATVHAMTTVSTGGMANSDASFSAYSVPTLVVACVFMVLSAFPFVRFVQLLGGHAEPLLRDSQIRVFLMILAVVVVFLLLATWTSTYDYDRPTVMQAIFNVISITTGTGYASADYMRWGPLAVMVFFFVGLIGGCAGSTSCSIKVFRYQILFASIRSQLRRIRTPHGIFTPRFEGRTVGEDVLSSVMSFFMFFVLTLGIVAVALGLTGLDFITSVSGAATAVANVGPGLGQEIGPAGNFAGLNDTAKWILCFAMLIGRLELLAVYVIFTVQFWRA